MANLQNNHIAKSIPLSVVMSVYNGEDYLADAINSILKQSFSDFEFVIINDGSTDNSSQILHEYAARDPRIRLVEQENTGLTVALRRGVEISRGQYVARMDADDISLPQRFERQIALLEAQPDLAASTCNLEHFSDDGTVSLVTKVDCDPQLLPLYMYFANRVGGHGQVMFRRSAYDAAGGYDPTFRYAQDYDLWTRMLDVGGFGVVPETLYRFRTGHDSVSKRNKEVQIELTVRIITREFQKLTRRPLDQATARALIYFWWARKPEITPMLDTISASLAMNRVINAFFAGKPYLPGMERNFRWSVMQNWRWRIPKAGRFNLARQALLLAHALMWAASAITTTNRKSDP